ncbi:MAG: hypothetical protein R8K20_02415, partial [Gallionellaceae bacterium]
MSGRMEEQQSIADQSEISINDMVGFIFTRRKILLISAMLGGLVMLGLTYKFGQYKAEAILVNRVGAAGSAGLVGATIRSSHAIDFFKWNKLKKNLPMLADRIVIEGEGKSEYFKALSSEFWWKKNVVPAYSFSKENSQDVLGVTRAR